MVTGVMYEPSTLLESFVLAQHPHCFSHEGLRRMGEPVEEQEAQIALMDAGAVLAETFEVLLREFLLHPRRRYSTMTAASSGGPRLSPPLLPQLCAYQDALAASKAVAPTPHVLRPGSRRSSRTCFGRASASSSLSSRSPRMTIMMRRKRRRSGTAASSDTTTCLGRCAPGCRASLLLQRCQPQQQCLRRRLLLAMRRWRWRWRAPPPSEEKRMMRSALFSFRFRSSSSTARVVCAAAAALSLLQ
jgi:hypothetical protein